MISRMCRNNSFDIVMSVYCIAEISTEVSNPNTSKCGPLAAQQLVVTLPHSCFLYEFER